VRGNGLRRARGLCLASGLLLVLGLAVVPSASARELCLVNTRFTVPNPPDSGDPGSPTEPQTSETASAQITVPRGDVVVVADTTRGRLSDTRTSDYPAATSPYFGTSWRVVSQGPAMSGLVYRVIVKVTRNYNPAVGAPSPEPVQWQYNLRYEIGGNNCPTGRPAPNTPLGEDPDDKSAAPIRDDSGGQGPLTGFLNPPGDFGPGTSTSHKTALNVQAALGDTLPNGSKPDQHYRVAPHTRTDFAVKVTNLGPSDQQLPWLNVNVSGPNGDTTTELGHHVGCEDIQHSVTDARHSALDCRMPKLPAGQSATVRLHVTFPGRGTKVTACLMRLSAQPDLDTVLSDPRGRHHAAAAIIFEAGG